MACLGCFGELLIAILCIGMVWIVVANFDITEEIFGENTEEIFARGALIAYTLGKREEGPGSRKVEAFSNEEFDICSRIEMGNIDLTIRYFDQGVWETVFSAYFSCEKTTTVDSGLYLRPVEDGGFKIQREYSSSSEPARIQVSIYRPGKWKRSLKGLKKINIHAVMGSNKRWEDLFP
ncbi:MAG TPA: hypothetical protein VKK31_12955 [Thermoanaerobaculia bacterium]|nr:hypothetical protein [Thermoanaerobaculia bacterium]